MAKDLYLLPTALAEAIDPNAILVWVKLSEKPAAQPLHVGGLQQALEHG
jgi:hypothetical protein